MIEMPSDLIPGLAASGPDPSLGDAAQLFAPFIGDWQIRTVHTPFDKPAATYDGFWSFRWGLGGRAVYDVIAYRLLDVPRDAPYRAGITVRFYDTELRMWRQVWIGAWTGVVIEFAARSDGSRIVIEGQHSPAKRFIWSFERIESKAFHWEGRTSYNGGGTWHLEQTIDGWRD